MDEWINPWTVEPERDPDKMTVGELFSPCVECRSTLNTDGSCGVCGQDAPTVQRIRDRRQWLKDHPEMIGVDDDE